MDCIEAIKERVKIEELVGRSLTVTGHGRVLTTTEHDSLKLFTETNTWYWFSRGQGGDVFDWWQFQQRCDFRQALEELARMAGVELLPLTPERRAEVEAERAKLRIFELAAAHFAKLLQAHPAAAAGREYCHGRGWTDETIRLARLGFVPVRRVDAVDEGGRGWTGTDKRPLAALLREAGLLEQPAARAVLSLPEEHLVYAHVRGGQVVYLSARSIVGKRHWNLPADLVGPRQTYELRPLGAAVASGVTILVEGQADAISLAQLGFHAVALCGVEAGAADRSGEAMISHVALDNDAAGQAKALELALTVGPLCQVLLWPEAVNDRPVKDANDMLQVPFNGNRAATVAAWLEAAPHAIELLARGAKRLKGDERSELIGRLAAAYAQLDEVTATDLAPNLAEALGVKFQQFKRLMVAAQEEADEQDAPAHYENSAGGVIGDVVFEQCVRWDEHGVPVCYLAWRGADGDGQIKTGTSLDVGGVTYLPHPATLDLIRKKVVLFPAEPLDFGSQRQLLADLRGFIHRWLDVDPFYEQLACYYVLFTWVYDAFETLPYLRAFGDYGTGKSRFLQTIGAICYRPMFVTGASTSSPIFRLIDLFRGTLIMDEADFANSDAESEMIKIVNVGYSRGGVVLRAEKDDNSETYYPSAKDVYGPKILATRRMFTDRATESRCLTKRMSTARPRPDVPRVINRTFWAEAQVLRNKCLAYRLRTFHAIDVESAQSDQSIEPRLDQVTLALKAIVDDKAMLDQINLFVRAYNATLITDRQMSLPAIVVQVLAEIWYHPEQDLTGVHRDWSIKNLAAKTLALLDTLDPDEKMNPRKLSGLLSEDLGLAKRTQDSETRRACLVIDEPTLQALMARYGIDAP